MNIAPHYFCKRKTALIMIIKAVGTPRGIRTLITPKSFSMLSAILLAVIITQAFRIRRLKKEIIKRDTADEFSRQWYWIEDKNNKQRQPLKKRKSLLSFLRSFL